MIHNQQRAMNGRRNIWNIYIPKYIIKKKTNSLITHKIHKIYQRKISSVGNNKIHVYIKNYKLRIKQLLLAKVSDDDDHCFFFLSFFLFIIYIIHIYIYIFGVSCSLLLLRLFSIISPGFSSFGLLFQNFIYFFAIFLIFVSRYF